MRNPIVDKGFSVRGVAQTQNKHLFLAEMVLQDWLPTSVLVSARILKAFVYSLVETQMCPNYKIINLPQRRTWPKCWTFFSKPPDLFQAVVQAGFWFRSSASLHSAWQGQGGEEGLLCLLGWTFLFCSPEQRNSNSSAAPAAAQSLRAAASQMFKAKQWIWGSGLACEMCLVCLREGKAGSRSAGINNITAQGANLGRSFRCIFWTCF